MNLEKLYIELEGEPKFRKSQAMQLIFKDLITDWQKSSTLPLSIQKRLNEACPLDLKAEIFGSKKSETMKILLELNDGEKAESVLLKHNDGRRTICVSSQVGCPLGCKFCATGEMGFVRNLSSDEIISQVLFFSRFLNKNETLHNRVTNVVFMGMGEPFLNYDNVMGAIRILNSRDAFNIGARRISVSTSGIIEGIEKLMREDLQINLAISLHAPNNDLRSSLMPISKKYPLSQLMKAASKYARLKSREVMFEYMLIGGVNDREQDALELSHIMKNRLFVVNLIRYNPTGMFRSSHASDIIRFKNILMQNGINVTQRYSFGQDINAACGQLADRHRSKSQGCSPEIIEKKSLE